MNVQETMQSLNEFEKRHLQGFAGKQVRNHHTYPYTDSTCVSGKDTS